MRVPNSDDNVACCWCTEEDTSLLYSDVSLDAEGETRESEVFNIGGGTAIGVLIVFFPVTASTSHQIYNTYITHI